MSSGRQKPMSCSCALGSLAPQEQCSCYRTGSLKECACFGAGRCLLSSVCPPVQGKGDVPLLACLLTQPSSMQGVGVPGVGWKWHLCSKSWINRQVLE